MAISSRLITPAALGSRTLRICGTPSFTRTLLSVILSMLAGTAVAVEPSMFTGKAVSVHDGDGAEHQCHASHSFHRGIGKHVDQKCTRERAYAGQPNKTLPSHGLLRLGSAFACSRPAHRLGRVRADPLSIGQSFRDG